MSKIDNFISYLLIISIPIYFLQGAVYESGSVISKSVLLLWMAISFFYLLKTIQQKEINNFSSKIILFLAINAMYWGFSSKIIGSIPTIDNFKNICVAFLSYFPFYYLAKANALSQTKFKVFALLLLTSFIISFLYNQNEIMERLGLYSQHLTNNSSYKFVVLFPLLVLFLNKKTLFYTLYIISLFFIIQGAKRGAIVCFAAQTFIIVLYKFLLNRRNNGIYNILITALILIAVVTITQYYYNANEYLQWRVSNMMLGDDVSGEVRIDNYTGIIDKCINGSLISLLFGHGFNGSLTLIGLYAHNDWLELLADLGVFGVILYIILLANLVNYYKRNKGYFDTDFKIMYFSVIATWFLKSVFSMGYISLETFALLTTVAYVQSKIECIKQSTLVIGNQSLD